MTNPNPSPSNLMILFLPAEQREYILTHFSTTCYIAQDLRFFSFVSDERCPSFYPDRISKTPMKDYMLLSPSVIWPDICIWHFHHEVGETCKNHYWIQCYLLLHHSPLVTVLQSRWADLIRPVPAWAAWVFVYMGASTLFSWLGIILGSLRKNWLVCISSRVFLPPPFKEKQAKAGITAALSRLLPPITSQRQLLMTVRLQQPTCRRWSWVHLSQSQPNGHCHHKESLCSSQKKRDYFKKNNSLFHRLVSWTGSE